MSITKGDILYRKADGQPIPVLRTRKLQDGITRLYLGHPARGRQADVYWGELGEYSDYTPTQTPELAQLWANTLKERAERLARCEAEREAERAFRLANRVVLNLPPEAGPMTTTERGVSVPIWAMVQSDKDLELVEESRTLEVEIYKVGRRVIDEAGESVYTKAYQVNWSAMGNQSPAVARAYARAILAAADLAESRPLTPTED